VLWHERLTAGPDGERAAQALLDLAATLSLAETDGAGLMEIPAHANGRGLREAGVLPNAGPGLSDVAQEGLDAHGIAAALVEGELSAVYLLGIDPLESTATHATTAAGSKTTPAAGANEAWEEHRALWSQALERASTVVVHAMFLTDGLREHANVVFPAQAYAEKKGTIVHPSGLVQRLRPAVAQLGATRPESDVLSDLTATLAAHTVAVGA
jgi:NADH-quinone oxidoreductase subunit G